MSRPAVVTIDGPAGVGKSTVARRLAERLGYAYLSSGAIYRAVAWRLAQGASLETILARSHVEFRDGPTGPQVLVDGVDASEGLHTAEASELAAAVSQRPEVRRFADAIQRAHATRGPIVVEGRDAGSVVFPDAGCKFYLDASLDARARRRRRDLVAAGDRRDLAVVRSEIAARDRADGTRTVAPLCQPPDATYVDSSELTVDEVVETMLREVERGCSTRS